MRLTLPFLLGLSLPLAWGIEVPAADPELRLEAPPGLVSGTIVTQSARITTQRADILSWSISLGLDGFIVLEASTSETDFDRVSKGGYAESGIHPDGTACYSVAVLSFTEPVVLPPGSLEILRMTCLVSRKEPGEARVTPREGLTLPGDERVFANEILVQGGGTAPITVPEASFRVKGCADFALAHAGAAPGDPPAEIEIRKGLPVDVDALIRVASLEHLGPTGFTFGLAHDPAVLAIESAALLEAFTEGFVKADGFARIEMSAAGVAVAVLSSASAPRAIGAGDHRFARVSYSLQAGGQPGDILTTSIALDDELPLGEGKSASTFQPRDALPCTRASIALRLVIGPHHWIRGDADGSGSMDLTDAVTILNHLFLGGSAPCMRAMEVNLDGGVDITDPITILGHLFLGQLPPAAPFPDCGVAEETLPCEMFACPAV